MVGQSLLPPSDHDGSQEEVKLVDQAGRDRLSGELGTADADVARRRALQLPDRFRIEIPLDPRPSG